MAAAARARRVLTAAAKKAEAAGVAASKGLRVGSAPDTFLGGAHQLARKLIEARAIFGAG